jgi:glyoxylase-like metal-dependent hydrolase (beta-lactamase superfamily II)
MQIIPLSIPTPFYVGDVNIYLIKNDPVTLIDVGPKTADAARVLREKLAANKVAFSDVRRIVLTHAHEDHCGLARQVRDEAKNAEILVHTWETGHLFGRLSQQHHKKLLLRSGVPESVFSEMRELYDEISLLTDALEDGEFVPLADETELEFESGSLKVLHTPGHTPGSCSFAREANRTLICGDCVLKRITPNPIVSPDPIDPEKRFPSLAEYLVSPRKATQLQTDSRIRRTWRTVTDFEEFSIVMFARSTTGSVAYFRW